jgi:UDP-2,3-diacylglucosamine hydrolase
MEKTIFISDAHIKGCESPEMETLCSFLKSLPSDTKTIVIAGDLFEFWVGCNKFVFYDYLPVLEALNDLKNRGIHITYIEGNHDFFMGPFFTEVLKAEVCPSEKIITLNGKKVYVAHGDRVNRKEYSYRLWRWLLRSRPMKVIASLTPPSLLFRIGMKLSNTSRNFPRKYFDMNSIFNDFARDKWREGYHGVILGHSHSPDYIEEECNGELRFYANLGDWLQFHTYLLYDERGFKLKTFTEEVRIKEKPKSVSSMQKKSIVN